MARIDPVIQAQVAGKEPIFALIFVAFVAALSYGVIANGPDYIEVKKRNMVTIKKEIMEKRRSEAIKEYQENYEKIYSTFEQNASSLKFKPAAALMDDVTQALKQNNLRLLSISRSQTETRPLTSRFLDASVVYVNILFEGSLSNALAFLKNFAETGVYRRLVRLSVAAPGGGNPETKFTVTIMLPSSDSDNL
jgi:hypothetical protein